MSELKNIQVEEVSLVDAGANPGANVLLYKRGNGAELVSSLKKIADQLTSQLEKAKEQELIKEFSKYEVLGYKAPELAPLMKQAKEQLPEQYEAMKNLLDQALALSANTFSEIGKSGGAPYSERDQVQKIAAQIQKAHPQLSPRKALDQAYLQVMNGGKE